MGRFISSINNDDDDDDDDSATVLSGIARNGRGGERVVASPSDRSAQSVDLLQEEDDVDDVVPTPTQESGKTAGKERSPFVSPAAQTLKALSQNMDSLLYGDSPAQNQEFSGRSKPTAVAHDNKYGQKECNNPFSNKTTSKPPPKPQSCLDWQQYHDKYDLIPFNITETTGGLGLVIQRGQFFPGGTAGAGKPHCRVLRIIPDSHAEKLNVKAGDWICRPLPGDTINQRSTSPVLAEFEEVQAWSKERPFHACSLRRKSSPASSGTEVAKDPSPVTQKGNSETHHSKSNSKVSKKLQRTTSFTSSDTDQDPVVSTIPRSIHGESEKTRVGDMKGVTSHSTPKTNVAHATRNGAANNLPNKPIETATAKKTTDNRKIMPFCRLCNYKRGNKPKIHHTWCPSHPFFHTNGAEELLERIEYGRRELQCHACETEYQRGKLEPSTAHSKRCNQYQSSESPKPQKRHEKCNNSHKKENYRPSVGDGDDDDDDDDDDKVPLSRHPIRKQPPPASSSSQQPKSKGIVSHRSKLVRQHSPSDAPNQKKPNSKPVFYTVTPQCDTDTCDAITKRSVLGSQSEQKQPPLRQNEPQTVKSHWVSTKENPWGPQGYVEGDILLYGPQMGMGHHDVLFPSPRYSSCPFSRHSNYCTTHHTPEEGFHVLSLRRDPMGATPWGFDVTRDEFGEACLVESVGAMSPAAAALTLGGDERVGLKIHDMILMINGQSVCGMSVLTLEVEIETSGPTLSLVVSRYKHADVVAEQTAAMERTMLLGIDKRCRDERLLGWHEIGNVQHNAPIITTGLLSKGTNDSDNVGGAIFRIHDDRNQHTKTTTTTTACRDGGDDDLSDGQSRTRIINSSDTDSYGCTPASNTCDMELPRENATSPMSKSSVSESNRSVRSSTDWKDDRNTWNGCVCGSIHSKSSQVFWLQCDSCGAWYDVAEKCVGFTMQEAEKLSKWSCMACPESESTAWETKADPVVKKPISKVGETVGALQGSEVRIRIDRAAVEAIVTTKDSALTKEVERSELENCRLYSESKILSPHVTADGCMLPLSQPTKLPDGSWKQPKGIVPVGMEGDCLRGQTRMSLSEDKKMSTMDSIKILKTTSPNRTRATSDSNMVSQFSSNTPGVEFETKKSRNVPDMAPLTVGCEAGFPDSVTENIPTNQRHHRKRKRNWRDSSPRSTDDGCLLPLSQPTKLHDGSWKKPAGKVPKGMAWDYTRGLWAPRVRSCRKKETLVSPNLEEDHYERQK